MIIKHELTKIVVEFEKHDSEYLKKYVKATIEMIFAVYDLRYDFAKTKEYKP